MSDQDVLVSVTTRRYESPAGVVSHERTAKATGSFEAAVASALSKRLAPWAREQAMRAVLARRPAAGQSVIYTGFFSKVRQLRIVVQPAETAWSAVRASPRKLPGLFLDRAADTAGLCTDEGSVA